MPKLPASWTIAWVDVSAPGKTFLATQQYEDQKSLEARIIALTSENLDYVVISGAVLPVTVDTSPRITIGDAEEPVKKTRARRRSSAEVAADKQAKLEAKKAKNGADKASVSA